MFEYSPPDDTQARTSIPSVSSPGSPFSTTAIPDQYHGLGNFSFVSPDQTPIKEVTDPEMKKVNSHFPALRSRNENKEEQKEDSTKN